VHYFTTDWSRPGAGDAGLLDGVILGLFFLAVAGAALGVGIALERLLSSLLHARPGT
jgi:hypothetical protein